jgi:hypothetical protein
MFLGKGERGRVMALYGYLGTITVVRYMGGHDVGRQDLPIILMGHHYDGSFNVKSNL